MEKKIQSELIFPNNIIVSPASGSESATLEENIYGGMLDEVNFMEVVDKSKKSVDGQEFDQAETLYSSIASRREFRFLRNGKLPGLLCMASSRRCPGNFSERKIEEAKTDPEIYVYIKTFGRSNPKALILRKCLRWMWGARPESFESLIQLRIFLTIAKYWRFPLIIESSLRGTLLELCGRLEGYRLDRSSVSYRILKG
jgi:hypothetical protein